MTELDKTKQLLNQNGYLFLHLGKGQIKLAKTCDKDCYKCNENDCINCKCLNNLIKEQF